MVVNPVPEVKERWSIKPVSLDELSVHDNEIFDVLTTNADKLDGAEGELAEGANVVSEASEVKPEAPNELRAATR